MQLPITEHEVRLAVAKAKAGRATAFDELPVEERRSDIAIHCLHKLLNKCFDAFMVKSVSKCSLFTYILEHFQ